MPDADLFALLGIPPTASATEAPPSSARGTDRRIALVVPHAEAIAGGRRPVLVERNTVCGRCRGTGAEGERTSPCATCRGSGRRGAKECRPCAGRGRFANSPCDSCTDGFVVVSESIALQLPPITGPVQKLRVAGKGDEVFGGAPGDLYIEVTVDRVGVLLEDGADTRFEVAVGKRHRWFGGDVEILTVDGPARVAVPRGVRDGDRLTLPGRGNLRSAGGDPYRGSSRGDHVVVFRVR